MIKVGDIVVALKDNDYVCEGMECVVKSISDDGKYECIPLMCEEHWKHGYFLSEGEIDKGHYEWVETDEEYKSGDVIKVVSDRIEKFKDFISTGIVHDDGSVDIAYAEIDDEENKNPKYEFFNKDEIRKVKLVWVHED